MKLTMRIILIPDPTNGENNSHSRFMKQCKLKDNEKN